MEFRQLQTFVIIAQEESFSRAAELLGYSQSAVTVQIRLLEEELQVRLFDRMGKRTVLTAQGRQMLEYANRILQEVNQARSAMIREAELLEPLHVGTLESLCFSKLPPVLGYFRTNYPKVAIKVTTASPKELITMMEKNQLDLIYFLDRPRYSNNWNKELEVREPIVFVASSDSPFAGRKGLELEEILEASRLPSEQREAARKMGSRFAKTIEKLDLPVCGTGIFPEFLEKRKGKTVSHCCIYGVFCACLDTGEEECLSHYLYAQTSAMVTNCVKTVPLSQSAGQKLLAGFFPEFEEILEEVRACGEADLCLSAPGFDLRGIQHERLYSRLYMS